MHIGLLIKKCREELSNVHRLLSRRRVGLLPFGYVTGSAFIPPPLYVIVALNLAGLREKDSKFNSHR